MLDQINSCNKEKFLNQLLKVQAQIKVTPVVKHGKPRVYFIDSNIKQRPDCSINERSICDCVFCDSDYDHNYDSNDDYDHDYNYNHDYNHDCGHTYESDHDCNFTLTQIIGIEIPISFDAAVSIKKGIQCCDIPIITSDCKDDCKDERMKNDPVCFLLKNKVQF